MNQQFGKRASDQARTHWDASLRATSGLHREGCCGHARILRKDRRRPDNARR